MKLREHGYDVLAVWEVEPVAKDEEVLGLAVSELRVILTFDKDFGRFTLNKPKHIWCNFAWSNPTKPGVRSTTSTNSANPQ